MWFDTYMTELSWATIETLYMVGVSSLITVLLGLPVGFLLYATQPNGLSPKPNLHKLLEIFTNLLRSIPFIILLALLIPVTRFIVGTSIGSTATIVPLTIGAIPFFARLIENTLQELPKGLSEAGRSFGASPYQILTLMLFPEALPAIIQNITLTIITLISYSAMAGAIGGGGLGALAIDYGYQRFELFVLLCAVVILIFLVQIIQTMGNKLSKKFTH